MKKLLAVSTAAAIGALAVPAIASAVTGGPVTQCRASFSQHPENSTPAWADDTFTRTTTIKPAGRIDTWAVHIFDAGHFTTVPDTKSDSGDVITDKVTGTFSGSGDYTVTSTGVPQCVKKESYDGSNDPATSDWPLHYFPVGATTTGIDPWHWQYDTDCEHMTEDSKAGTAGHMTGKVCTPAPTPTTPEPTPSDSNPAPSDSPSPSDSSSPTSDAPAPTPVKSNLPVTG